MSILKLLPKGFFLPSQVIGTKNALHVKNYIETMAYENILARKFTAWNVPQFTV